MIWIKFSGWYKNSIKLRNMVVSLAHNKTNLLLTLYNTIYAIFDSMIYFIHICLFKLNIKTKVDLY